METSEDDAGTATSASRRTSAREKDVGLAEDVDATHNLQHELSETRASCGTPAMSEDNFDGDSVPSPSTKDTSTEAILDMIDDFIGDPIEPRRVPLEPQVDVDLASGRVTTPPPQSAPASVDSQHNKQSEELQEKITTSPCTLSMPVSADTECHSENVPANVHPAKVECTPNSEILIFEHSSPQASSSVQLDANENGSTLETEDSQNVEPDMSTVGLITAPPSSSVDTKQDISDASECERTLKCVRSSENRDNVTVELAESTSSECSVSESKAFSMEPTVSRSPLKRRLIRPAPSDRRPDSTVSSTVDTQITDIHTTEQASSENITKDVSSSSDAVAVHGIAIPEEISNVSEISICKAETSTAPSRKIKLVRPKVTPVISNSIQTETQKAATFERDRCQSTSSDDISTPSVEPSLEGGRQDAAVRTEGQISRLSAVCDDTTDQQLFAQGSEGSHDVSSNSQEISVKKSSDEKPKSIEIPEALGTSPLNQTDNKSISNALSTNQCLRTPDIPSISLLDKVEIHCKDNTSGDNNSNEELKVPPIKLSLSLTKPSETNTNILHAHDSSTATNLDSTHGDTSKSSTPHDQSIPKALRPYEGDNKQIEHSVKSVIECDIVKSDDKKVPPIKLNLTNTEHKSSESTSGIQKPNIAEDDLSSHSSDDSVKQVPKLTIKLTNKYNEEAKSPVPKLTIKPLRPPTERNTDSSDSDVQIPSVTKINIKPIPKPNEKLNESVAKPLPLTAEQHTSDSDTSKQIPNVTKINIKPIPKPIEEECERISKLLQPDAAQTNDDCETNEHIPIVTKKNIKPITKQIENTNESLSKPLQSPVKQNSDEPDTNQHIPSVTKINIKPIPKPNENVAETASKPQRMPAQQNVDGDTSKQIPSVSKINIKPILKPTEKGHESVSKHFRSALEKNIETSDTNLQIPSVTKINIKPILKPIEKQDESISISSRLATEQNKDDHDINQQIPSVTKINIKPILKPNEIPSKTSHPAAEENIDDHNTNQQIPNVTKINIKPILKPSEKDNDNTSKTSAEPNFDDNVSNKQIPNVTKLNIKPIQKPTKHVNDSSSMSYPESHQNDLGIRNDQIPSITKLNIKPIVKPPEKVNEKHRKSSSSEISESEYSENDESTSTSDQASASDQGPLDTVPKVTIKLGKPGTECEGKFYTEKNVPKLTLKNIQHSDDQSVDKQPEKVPKITIKTVTKPDSQPLSPKLTIKPFKQSENVPKDNEIPKLKISSESLTSTVEVKEHQHVPKITIKPVTKSDVDGTTKTPKKSTVVCDSSDHIPVVTKLNIKPILKPTESRESSDSFDDKVPVVSKLNIKPVIKPKDNEVDSSIEDVPKIIKLNIKPLKNPEENSSEQKDCDEMNADMKDSSIPVVTKLNIKPIVKPEEEVLKDSENQSSETGNSSDDNADHIPIVTKLNIKPIVKPSELEEPSKPVHNEQCIPVVTKLNIKPLIKPEDNLSPSSPKKETSRSPGSAGIPVVTKLNIKPIIKPEDLQSKNQDENIEKSGKHPLVMKINVKNVSDGLSDDHLCNNIAGKAHSPKMPNSPRASKRSAIESNAEQSSKSKSSRSVETVKMFECNPESPSLLQTECPSTLEKSCNSNIVAEIVQGTIINEVYSSSKDQPSSKPISIDETIPDGAVQQNKTKNESLPLIDNKCSKKSANQINEVINEVNETNMRIAEHYNVNYSKSSILNCTLLKKLLSSTREVDKTQETKPTNCLSQSEKPQSTLLNCKDGKMNEEGELQKKHSPKSEKVNDFSHSSDALNMRSIQDVHREANESVTKPLEIITDKMTNQDSGQDSPRIILKINKTDHGASAKIITEETNKPTDCSILNDSHTSERAGETLNTVPSPKKHVNSRRKAATDSPANLTMGKRLRSSRIVESVEKSPVLKRNINKRPSATESTSPPQPKESELSILETKRMKLEQILSVNKSLTITPVVSKNTQTSPSKSNVVFNQGGKVSHNHSLINNENCSQKNGNSKLHNILSNLQAKQMQTLQLNDTSASEKAVEITTEVESNTSTGSSDVVVEITRVENYRPEVQEMLINESSICDLTGPEEVSQDPLEVDCTKTPPEDIKETTSAQTVELTPTPRKRGRPRKLPVTDPGKAPTPLPVPALVERPQRSLRLMRERPAILKKPRGGRGRGRGGRRTLTPARAPSPLPSPSPEPVVVVEVADARAPSPIDPTSSRIKLPRMTEALDKSSCATPLSSRRRSEAAPPDLKLFSSAVVLENPVKEEEFMKSPEVGARPRSGRGSRGGRGRTPRNRGRGRGGGRGAMYMKETMGIYGRVCGPATTTVQLFEEETCMMDDNATPSKPSHLLDEDSQSSVKSSTNDSNKMKKSKFADLFDSNKVWTAADVKEYTWPPPETPNAEHQVMMIQEQVAMFLGVKSFKRRYPELKRRTVGGEEREYVLSKGVVSEALCDLGITAVDASEVLDIMLSDYPHKYEEYRSHQRERQIASTAQETIESKAEERPIKVEVKVEKTSEKPEPPKVDPEKARQDMAAAAIASAAEWNALANAWRRPACVDLQSNTVHRRRAPPAPPPPPRVRPPAGFYPHALLPGQFQHWFRAYTDQQLRYFPLNTVLAAPPAPPSPAESSSESEASWGEHSSSSDDSDAPHHHSAKRKKLSRVKRSSQQEKEKEKEECRSPDAELCRSCGLRLEANRKHTHERFLVCANCNAKLHPLCVELPADTIRKCREYAWQCAECKSCCACRRPQDDDKMLFCDLCDRGFHIYCVGLDAVPSGRWHCVECAICKSCGARDPNGLTPGAPGASTAGPSTPGPSTPGLSTGEWHHQTRRGPGGHKVYSHSLCTPCARAYRIGRYCPLCERSFIGPKGTMQLVICKLCDRQLHQECVRQTVSSLRVLDYTCAECRRGGITSRAAAVRVAPRTIATLFMAKRRFNKYAHRQYLASRLAAQAAPDADDALAAQAAPDADDAPAHAPAPAPAPRTDYL